MKILIVGDQHRTDKRPKNRTDDYYATLIRKTLWQFDFAMRNSCECIIFPGDVFDTYKTPFNVVREMIRLTRKCEDGVIGIKCLYTFGQHDVRYHTTDVNNTPLGVLLAGTSGELLGSEPFVFDNNGKPVHVYGAGWGEDVPEPVDNEACNIIATHRMVIGDNPLWEGQTDYVTAKDLLQDTRYALWACGDNHQRVIASTLRHKHVVNMGSMMRSTIAQFGHTPAVCLYDTDTRRISIHDIPHAPFENVFKADEIAEKVETDTRIQDFVESLKSVDTSVTDFPKALAAYMKTNDIPDNVVTAINKITNMEKYHG